MTSHEAMPHLPPVDPVSAEHVAATSLTPELLASLLADGDDELAAWTLLHALEEQPRAAVFDGLVTDAMRLVGERWARGELSIADEHWASQTLVRALDLVRPELGPEGRVGPLVVIASVAGELHSLGLVCLEQCLSEAGWQVANLGADVPAEDLARFVRERSPQCVALAAIHPARLPVVAATAAAIREAAGGARFPILLGGPLAARPGAAEAAGVDWAGTTISGALSFCATIAPEADIRP
jgi:methanogenic corrinoid protein MtbC1